MINTGNIQINNFLIGDSSVTGVYVGNTLVWPTDGDYTYKLKNLTVHYSSGDALHPNCNNYAWLTAKLVTILGSEENVSNADYDLIPVLKTGSSNPVVDGKNLYVISDDSTIGKTIIKANPYLKEKEYNRQGQVVFTGTYTINNSTIGGNDSNGWSSGVNASSVILMKNEKTVTPLSQTTTAVHSPSLENEELPAAVPVNSSTDITTTVSSCTRVYSETSEKIEWTSGVITGGVTTTGKTSNVTPRSVRTVPIYPNTATTTNGGNSITLPTNNSDTERKWEVYVTFDNIESSDYAILTQRGNVYAYSSITNVSLIYNTIPCTGGTVEPTVSFNQSYGWYPDTTLLGQITDKSKASITYYIDYGNNVQTSTDGEVQAGSMHTNPYPPDDNGHGRAIAECYVSITSHGKTYDGINSKVTVYQDPNRIENTYSEITIKISDTAYSVYPVDPQQATYTYVPTARRTYTWTTNEQSSDDITSGFTVEKGSYISSVTQSSPYKFTINENTGNARDTYINVKDGSYGSQRLTIRQGAVAYVFSPYEPRDNAFSIGYNDQSFTISVQSTRNGSPYAISISDITFNSNGFSGLSKNGVTQSPLDNTVYVATFTCNANSSNSVKSVTITFKQPTSNNSIEYNVQQAAYIAPTISFDSQIVKIGTTGGNTGTFKLKTNKNWSINTETFSMCDFNGDSLGSDAAALGGFKVDNSSGSSGAGDEVWHEITVTRGAYRTNSIVCITINYGNTSANVIVVPNLTMSWSSNISSNKWYAPGTGGSITAINTTYPESTITWSSMENWLTASGTTLTAYNNTSGSQRSTYVTATGGYGGTYFGINYDDHPDLSPIQVIQSDNTPAFESVKYANYGINNFSTITFPRTTPIKTWPAATTGLSNGIVMRVFVNSNTTKLVCEMSTTVSGNSNNILLSSTASSPNQGKKITFTSFTTSGSDRYAQFVVYPDQANTSSSTVTYTLKLTLNDNASITRTMPFAQSGASTPYNGIGSWDSI